jgi:hypothetical protein
MEVIKQMKTTTKTIKPSNIQNIQRKHFNFVIKLTEMKTKQIQAAKQHNHSHSNKNKTSKQR